MVSAEDVDRKRCDGIAPRMRHVRRARAVDTRADGFTRAMASRTSAGSSRSTRCHVASRAMSSGGLARASSRRRRRVPARSCDEVAAGETGGTGDEDWTPSAPAFCVLRLVVRP